MAFMYVLVVCMQQIATARSVVLQLEKLIFMAHTLAWVDLTPDGRGKLINRVWGSNSMVLRL